MHKVPPSEKLRKEIDAVVSGEVNAGDKGELLGTILEKSVQMIVQKILEKEVEDYLGRGYYQREAESRPGHRNGYEPKRLKTAEGEVQIEAPQLRGTEQTYRSEFMKRIGGLSSELKRMAVEMYVRGLSTRDIEEVLRDPETGSLLLSKDGISELTEELWEEYERFCERDLSGYDVVYLFVDGVFESLRQRAGMKEAILCSWGITSSGDKVLLHLGLGNKESFDSWRDFFRHMQGRGLRVPLLVVSDGAPGLRKAIAECFPDSRRQRCLFHKTGNIRNKLPQEGVDEVMPQIKSAYYQTDPEIAKLCASKILEAYSGKYPSAMKSFQEDFDACIQHMNFPSGHQRHITTTNLLERVFEEQKRRTKIIPRFFDEKSCLKLVYATMFRVSQKWRRVKMSDYDLTLLHNLRQLYGWEEDKDGYISKQTAA